MHGVESTPEACVPNMLIDSFAPTPDAVEIHSIVINASRATVYRELRTADLGQSVIIKSLLALRSIPGYIAHPCAIPQNRQITMQTLMDSGFGLLAEKPGEEIVLGITGRFWRPAGNVSPFNRPDFDRPVRAGFARGVWNFSVSEQSRDRLFLRLRLELPVATRPAGESFLPIGLWCGLSAG